MVAEYDVVEVAEVAFLYPKLFEEAMLVFFKCARCRCRCRSGDWQ